MKSFRASESKSFEGTSVIAIQSPPQTLRIPQPSAEVKVAEFMIGAADRLSLQVETERIAAMPVL